MNLISLKGRAMLVDAALKAIADRYGGLTPELSVGYRAAMIGRERFEDWANVAVSIGNNTGAVFATENMMREGAVSFTDRGRHLYVFCHLSTGSVLRMDLLPDTLKLPPCASKTEDAILRGKDVPDADLDRYRKIVDALVGRLLSLPEEDLFHVSSYRCRPAQQGIDDLCRFVACHRCGAQVRLNRLFEAEGFRLCASCAGIEPFWFSKKDPTASPGSMPQNCTSETS